MKLLFIHLYKKYITRKKEIVPEIKKNYTIKSLFKKYLQFFMIFFLIITALFITLLGQFLRFEVAGGAFLFLDIFLPFLFFCWAGTHIINKKNIWTELKKFPLFFEGLLVLIIFTLSLFFSAIHLSLIEIAQSGFYLFRYFFLFSFAIVVFHELHTDEKKQIIFIKSSILIAVLLAILGFIQLFYYPDFRAMAEKGWDPHIGRLLSTWFDPNFLGSFFSFILVIMAGIFGVFVQKKSLFSFVSLKKNYNNQQSYIFIFCTLTLLIALLITFSRSALLAFIIPIALIGLLYFRTLLLVAGLFIILILPFSPRASERILDGINSAVSVAETQTLFMPDPTARLRVENFKQGISLAENNFWTGIGFNSIRLYKTQNIHSSGGFDSSLLTVMVTSGIFGLFAFLFFYFSLAKKVLWNALQEKNRVIKGVKIGFTISLLGIFAQSFFINSLFYSLFMLFVFGFMGLGLTKSKKNNT